MNGNVFIGYVSEYSEASGHYYVRIPGYGVYSPEGIVAYTISPVPGGGMKGAPKIAKDTEVLLADIDGAYYIIGFPQVKGPVIHNSYFPTRPISPGEMFLKDEKGRAFGINKDGGFSVFLTPYAKMALNYITRKLTATLANMRLNFTAGSLEYEYDEQLKQSKGTLMIHKRMNSGTPGVPPEDRVQIKVGNLGPVDTHMVEGYIKQDFTPAKLAGFSTIFKIGKQYDMTWLDIATQIGPVAASAVNYSVKMDTLGKAIFSIKGNATSETSVTMDALLNRIDVKASAGPTSEVTMSLDSALGVELIVNKDKASIIIDPLGNITIKQNPLAKLYLGGETNAQQLVTKSWLDMIFANHVHPTAAPGPPSPPVPIPLPVVADAATNPYTFTTLAE